VKTPTPHSNPTLARKRSSARRRSLKPPNWSNHRINGDFSSSKNLATTDAGILPSLIAEAKSAGTLSNDLPACANNNNASFNPPLFPSLLSPSPAPPSPCPPCPSLFFPPPEESPPSKERAAESVEWRMKRGSVRWLIRKEGEGEGEGVIRRRRESGGKEKEGMDLGVEGEWEEREWEEGGTKEKAIDDIVAFSLTCEAAHTTHSLRGFSCVMLLWLMTSFDD